MGSPIHFQAMVCASSRHVSDRRGSSSSHMRASGKTSSMSQSWIVVRRSDSTARMSTSSRYARSLESQLTVIIEASNVGHFLGLRTGCQYTKSISGNQIRTSEDFNGHTQPSASLSFVLIPAMMTRFPLLFGYRLDSDHFKNRKSQKMSVGSQLDQHANSYLIA